MSEESRRLREICERGKFDELLEGYLRFCRSSTQDAEETEKISKGKKDGVRFPNTAGFCRFCGVGESELMLLRKSYPKSWERLCAVLEDEALNSNLSATVLSVYLKRRLGYDREEQSEREDGQLRVIFDHDIGEDGR